RRFGQVVVVRGHRVENTLPRDKTWPPATTPRRMREASSALASSPKTRGDCVYSNRTVLYPLCRQGGCPRPLVAPEQRSSPVAERRSKRRVPRSSPADPRPPSRLSRGRRGERGNV